MKKLLLQDILKKFPLPVNILLSLIAFTVLSCTPDDNELGRDIFPPGDNIFVHYDTLNDMVNYPVSGVPYVISENPYNPQNTRLFLLGNTWDSITGYTRTDIVTQFNPTSSFIYGPNMVIDSLVLYLYFAESSPDQVQQLNIKIHELTERIYMDSIYFTNYDISGKYNPVPLVEKSINPVDTTLYEFIINDPVFLDKFINPPDDTLLFINDSLFKDYFNGFYITSDDIGDEGLISWIHLSRGVTRLSMKYANDSTEIDTTLGKDYKWSHFSITEYTSQKINIYQHDHSGTALAAILDQPDSQSSISYVQGLSGVNTRLRLNGIENWLDSGVVAINSAQLIFEVLPDSMSGIPISELPDRLILLTELGEGKYEKIYDFVVDPDKFDGKLRPVSEGVFFDTTYVYRFNIGLHYQNLINGNTENRDIVLQLYDSRTNNKIVKLWSNYADNNSSLKLKIIYTKL